MSEQYAVAVDLGGTNARAALVRDDGTIGDREQKRTPASEGPDAVIEVLVELIEDVRKDAPRASLRGVGIGFPGFLYLPEGRVYHAPNLKGWDGYELRRTLEEKLGLPVRCENDANAAAIGEYTFGAAQGVRELCQLTLGTGLGSGFILRGDIYHGAGGMAGEFGHVPVIHTADAFVCGCGKRGCLETVVSTKGFRNLARARWDDRHGLDSVLYTQTHGDADAIDLEQAAEAARASDAFARELWNEMGHWLGVGLAILGNSLNLERVVIGGGVAAAWDLFIDSARRTLADRALPAIVDQLDVVQSNLGDNAGTLGAAALLLGSS